MFHAQGLILELASKPTAYLILCDWKLYGLLSEYFANFYMHIQVLNLFNERPLCSIRVF